MPRFTSSVIKDTSGFVSSVVRSKQDSRAGMLTRARDVFDIRLTATRTYLLVRSSLRHWHELGTRDRKEIVTPIATWTELSQALA